MTDVVPFPIQAPSQPSVTDSIEPPGEHPAEHERWKRHTQVFFALVDYVADLRPTLSPAEAIAAATAISASYDAEVQVECIEELTTAVQDLDP